jgi:hypothetical protein
LPALPLSKLTSNCHSDSQIPGFDFPCLDGDSLRIDLDGLDLTGDTCIDFEGEEGNVLLGEAFFRSETFLLGDVCAAVVVDGNASRIASFPFP